jgi:chromosomal replication initiator protein
MNIHPTQIIDKVSDYYHPELGRLYTKSRLTDVRMARQISMFFMKDLTNLTWGQIGNYFNRDHATAIHSYKVVLNEFETNTAYRCDINEIRRLLLKSMDYNCDLPVQYMLMQIFGKQLI